MDVAGKTNNRFVYYSPILTDLETSLLQIRTLVGDDKITHIHTKEIQLITRQALALIEYALFVSDASQQELPLTSISAAATVTDVAEGLRQLAGTYNIEIETDITSHLEPVYANKMAVKGAIYGLVSSMILSKGYSIDKSRIVIAAQETKPQTQRLGVYSPDISLGGSTIKIARSLFGKAKNVAPNGVSGGGLGLVISDQLAAFLGSELKAYTHRGIRGYGFYLQQTQQLNLL